LIDCKREKLEECIVRNDEVVGSIPTSSTIFNHLQSHSFGFVPLLPQFGF
jgi:hypothetical protein